MTVKTALVTGAAKRIGAGIARALHAGGMNTVIHYHRSATEAEALCASLNKERPGSAHLLQADLLDDSCCSRLIDQACSFHGGLDVLVNNASVFYPTPLAETTIAQWDEIMGTNLRAPFFLSRQAAPALRRSGGCIVNVTDIHAIRPLRNYPVYSTAKAGLEMLTRALAKELAPGIRVNAVSPGAILWPEAMDDALRDQIVSRTMLKRPGTVEDLSKAVLFLGCDADYVTGQVLVIDGGRTLYS